MGRKFIKPENKRIVAREGLIIISLIILSGICLLINSQLTDFHRYAINGQAIELATYGPKPQGTSIRLLIPQGIILQFPRVTNQAIIESILFRDYSNIEYDDWTTYTPTGDVVNSSFFNAENASYDSQGNRLSFSFLGVNKSLWTIALYFFLCAYPLYWIIRFILWAIHTLRGNVTGLG